MHLAVATNTSYVINDLKREFNKLNQDIKILTTISSSGKLTAQIANNAPYHIFMSANMQYPDFLYKNNMSISKPRIYAKGSIAILSNKDQDFSNGINIITKKHIKKIAIANPKIAPYGKASMEAIKNANLYNEINSKLIYSESIAQALLYTMVATDIGFVAKSLLYSPKMKHLKKNIHWIDVDSKLYTPINQGVVLLKRAKSNEGAKKFYDFILSKRAKEIFAKFGYL